MQALELTSNADEKKQLKTRCGALIDVADRIKKSDEWTPSVDPNTKEAQIGRWAASIDPRHSPGPAYQDAGSVWPGSSPHHGTLEHTPRSRPPEDLLSASGNSPISSIVFPRAHINSWPKEPAQLCTETTLDILPCLSSISETTNLSRCTEAGKHLLIRNTKAVNKPVTRTHWMLDLFRKQLKVRSRRCLSLTISDQAQQLMALLRWPWRGPKHRNLHLPCTSTDSLSRFPQESGRERKTSSC